eukprot:9285864-Pyramimonas_sp.AAC.1
MARNCHFLNNFVPVVMLAMLSNMDFQATLTKDAVVEYMSTNLVRPGGADQGHGAQLLHVHGESQRVPARHRVRRAPVVQPPVDQRGQVPARVHALIFGAPRFMCTREFRG